MSKNSLFHDFITYNFGEYINEICFTIKHKTSKNRVYTLAKVFILLCDVFASQGVMKNINI